VRRKLVAVVNEPPASLRSFDPAGLTDEALGDAFAQWRAARRGFRDEHGWPGGFLLELQQTYDIRRRVLYGVAVPGEPW